MIRLNTKNRLQIFIILKQNMKIIEAEASKLKRSVDYSLKIIELLIIITTTKNVNPSRSHDPTTSFTEVSYGDNHDIALQQMLELPQQNNTTTQTV